jgi:hypothetical protein
MSAQTTSTNSSRRSGGIVAGAILVAVGLLTLVGQIPGIEIGLYFLPALSLIFFVAGFASRNVGLLIPAGIIMGVGAGSILVTELPLSGTAEGGAFMLALAGGFALITLSGLVLRKFMYWPLIPAAFIALFGVALLSGETGLSALKMLRYVWPVALILAGGALILKRK